MPTPIRWLAVLKAVVCGLLLLCYQLARSLCNETRDLRSLCRRKTSLFRHVSHGPFGVKPEMRKKWSFSAAEQILCSRPCYSLWYSRPGSDQPPLLSLSWTCSESFVDLDKALRWHQNSGHNPFDAKIGKRTCFFFVEAAHQGAWECELQAVVMRWLVDGDFPFEVRKRKDSRKGSFLVMQVFSFWCGSFLDTWDRDSWSTSLEPTNFWKKTQSSCR